MVLTNFGVVLIFIIGGILFLNAGLFISKIVRPNRPNYEKLTAYESGEEAVGNTWNKFNVKYFSIALIFILFEVEALFLFPCAIIFDHPTLNDFTQNQWALFALTEIGIFLFVLILALAFAWRLGYIDWLKPDVEKPDYKGVVPKSLYDKVNERY